jgi:hypothetical protein
MFPHFLLKPPGMRAASRHDTRKLKQLQMGVVLLGKTQDWEIACNTANPAHAALRSDSSTSLRWAARFGFHRIIHKVKCDGLAEAGVFKTRGDLELFAAGRL